MTEAVAQDENTHPAKEERSFPGRDQDENASLLEDRIVDPELVSRPLNRDSLYLYFRKLGPRSLSKTNSRSPKMRSPGEHG
jgi:hypothetical protein